MTERRGIREISRRTFVAGLGVAGACLVLLPIDPAVAAQPNPKHRMFALILNESIETKNIRAAIDRNGKSLTPREKEILLSLSPTELGVLGSFRKKLSRLGVIVPG
jgi:hypothetical protein